MLPPSPDTNMRTVFRHPVESLLGEPGPKKRSALASGPGDSGLGIMGPHAPSALESNHPIRASHDSMIIGLVPPPRTYGGAALAQLEDRLWSF